MDRSSQKPKQDASMLTADDGKSPQQWHHDAGILIKGTLTCFGFWPPYLKSYRRKRRNPETGHKNNYTWMERLPCGEKMIKTRIMKFRKKKRRGDIIKVYKVLVEDNTWLQTNWELLFLLFLSLTKRDLEKCSINFSSNTLKAEIVNIFY